MALSAVGKLPPATRTHGRSKGKWRGHEEDAKELRLLAERESDPELRWGRLAVRQTPSVAQRIKQAVEKGESPGFEHDGGSFRVKTRKSENQNRAPINSSTRQPYVLYDVWARFVPQD